MRQFIFPFILSVWLLPAALAFADNTATATPTPARQAPPGFQKVEGAPSTENVDANKLVVAAYATVLIGVLGYVIMVARKQSEIAKEMQELAAQIEGVKRS